MLRLRKNGSEAQRTYIVTVKFTVEDCDNENEVEKKMVKVLPNLMKLNKDGVGCVTKLKSVKLCPTFAAISLAKLLEECGI